MTAFASSECKNCFKPTVAVPVTEGAYQSTEPARRQYELLHLIKSAFNVEMSCGLQHSHRTRIIELNKSAFFCPTISQFNATPCPCGSVSSTSTAGQQVSVCVSLCVTHTHTHTCVFLESVFSRRLFSQSAFFQGVFSKIHFPETYFPKTYFPEAYFPTAYFPKSIFYVCWFLVRICGEIQSSCWSSFEFDLSAATCMMESQKCQQCAHWKLSDYCTNHSFPKNHFWHFLKHGIKNVKQVLRHFLDLCIACLFDC